ncbi:hypothetical protein PV04_09578 [Phialophora macrospora]|uniref:Uncharacterized protein n=1 Tax=Phialophora macrospora TaxID=1851006 RepID=A0A0D2FCT3_9EURO|nr:hypothetical protein PV04_09578 [Phialophora macrospora]
MVHSPINTSSLSASATTTKPPKSEAPARPGSLPRRSSSLHKLLITKLRPLPFQYLWWLWHSKSSHTPAAASTTPPARSISQPTIDAYQLSLLVENVADIAAFYRIFNNLPWTSIRWGDSIHIFRAGVRPLWEDEENRRGGRWLIRVRPDPGAHADADARVGVVDDGEGQHGRRKDVRTWEEVCLLCLGERDHILGVSFSPRANFTHISIWTKQGDNSRSILLLERAILTGLSSDLRPKSSADFNFRRHAEKIGSAGGMGVQMMLSRRQLQAQMQMMGSFQSSSSAVGATVMGRPGPIRALTVG